MVQQKSSTVNTSVDVNVNGQKVEVNVSPSPTASASPSSNPSPTSNPSAEVDLRFNFIEFVKNEISEIKDLFSSLLS